jgi:hypothetical protein
MLQYLDVAYVAVAIHICCTSIFQMFHMCVGSAGRDQLLLLYLLDIHCLFNCQTALFGLVTSLRLPVERACSILEVGQHTYVAIAIHVCCKCMF